MNPINTISAAFITAGLMLAPAAMAAAALPLGLSAYDAKTDEASFATSEIIVKLAQPQLLQKNKSADASLLAATNQAGARIKKLLPRLGMAILETDQPMAQVMDKLQRTGAVSYATPSHGHKPMGQLLPNDTIFGQQSGLHTSDEYSLITGKPPVPDADINAPEAWDIRTDASDVLIAIIDTGINYKDIELADNIWVNPGEIAGNSLDDDNNGYVDDVHGINAVTGSSDPMDVFVHGTYVANVIANKGNNGLGSAGVVWKTKLLGLMAYDQRSGRIYDAALLESLEYVLALKEAHQLKQVIINISFGSTSYSEALKDALTTVQNAGVLMVASAGDYNLNNDLIPFYPASYELDAMVSVASSDPVRGGKGKNSSWGCGSVDLTAPGENTVFSWTGVSYIQSGSSFAAAMATGVAALTWAEHPEWSWREVKDALMASSKPMSGLEGLSVSQGIVQADKALMYSGTTPSIWGQTPTIGLPGDEVRIKGRHFGNSAGVVRLHGQDETALDILSWKDDEILAKLPEDTSFGSKGLVVSTAEGSSSGQACYLVSASARPVAQLHTPRSDAAVAAVGEDIWVFGGLAYSGTTATVEKFNPATAEVTSNSGWVMPTAVMGASSGVINNKVYIAGGAGFSYNVQDKVQIFNPVDQSWSEGAAAPHAFFLAASAVYQDKLYVFGGLTSFLNKVLLPTAISDAVMVYDPAKDSWSELQAMPTSLYGAAAVADPQGNGIILTGGRHGADEGSLPQNQASRFNPQDGSWTPLAAMKAGRYLHQMVADDAQVYSLLGQSPGGANDAGELFKNAAWQPAVKVDVGLYEAGATALGGSGYLLGGIGQFSDSGILTTTFSPNILQYALVSPLTPATGGEQGGSGNGPVTGQPGSGQPQTPSAQTSSGAAGTLLLPLLALAWRRRRLQLAVQAALGLATISGSVQAETTTPAADTVASMESHQPKTLLVKFADPQLVATFSAGTDAKVNQQINQVLQEAGVSVSQIFTHSGLVAVEAGGGTKRAISVLAANKLVDYAVPSFQRQTLSTYPNDPNFQALWGLENQGQTVNDITSLPDQDINAPEGWDLRTDASNVVVAVLDDSFYTAHPDLQANVWLNPTEIADNGIDDDNNGYVDDMHGVSTSIVTGGHYTGNSSHATAVAGIIGAVGNNGIGTAGVAWKVQLMNLAGLDDIGTVINDVGVVRAIDYLIDTKQRLQLPRVVLNMSWGGSQYSPALDDALQAAQAAGILIVAAAGNGPEFNVDKQPNYPGNLPLDAMVTVGGYDHSAEKVSSYSAYGCHNVDLAAPGSDSYSLGNEFEHYWTSNGTSMASAYIAGAAALLWEEHPYATALDIKSALLHGAQATPWLATLNQTGGRFRLDQAFAAGITKPAVWQIAPYTAAPGKVVTLRGQNFGQTPGSVKLKDLQTGAEVQAEVRSWKTNEVEIQLPYDIPYSDRAAIVSTASGESNPSCLLVSENAYSIGEMARGRHDAAYAQVGEDLWIFGGEIWAYNSYGATYTNSVERFNVSSRTSTASNKVTMPKALFGARAAAIGSKIYIVGGVTNLGFDRWNVENSLLIFDTETQNWTEGATLPVALTQAGVVAVDGKIYVFGGNIGNYPGNIASGQSYIYDPASDSWSQGADLPIPVIDPGVDVDPKTGIVTLLGGFVVADLYADPSAVPNLQLFDPVSLSWSMGPSMQRPRYGMGVLRHGDTLVAVSGYGASTQEKTWDHAETLIDGQWQLTTRIGMELGDAAVAKGTEEGFVLGGINKTYGGDRLIWAFPLERAQPVAPAPTPQPVPEPAPVKSSGGSMGFVVMLLALLRLRRR